MRRTAPRAVMWPPKAYVVMVLPMLLATLAGCGLLGGSESTVAGVATPAPRPTRAPTTPTPTPTPDPGSTATPVPNLTADDAQRTVFQRVSRCADQISESRAGRVEITFSTGFDPVDQAWIVEAISDDGTLTFGSWIVGDVDGQISPQDTVAGVINAPGIDCGEPRAFLARGATPPMFSTPVPTPTALPTATPTPGPTATPTPTPRPAITSSEQARLRVWISVFNCYDHFPALENFTVYEEDVRSWIVEGKSTVAHYGLWTIEGNSGEITPADQIASEAAALCRIPAGASFPAVVTGEQAQVLVWVATYDCFNPRATADSFVARQDNPQRWVVEGKEETTTLVEVERTVEGDTETFTEERKVTNFYGLWFVDTSTGTVTAWDDVARSTATDPCYQRPFR